MKKFIVLFGIVWAQSAAAQSEQVQEEGSSAWVKVPEAVRAASAAPAPRPGRAATVAPARARTRPAAPVRVAATTTNTVAQPAPASPPTMGRKAGAVLRRELPKTATEAPAPKTKFENTNSKVGRFKKAKDKRMD